MKFVSGGLSSIGERLYLNASSADVQFVFCSTEKELEYIPAHKPMLGAISDVFQSMFSGFWQSKDLVAMTECSPDAFKLFLRFFYFNDVELTVEHIHEIVDLGERYNVIECLMACAHFVQSHLSNRTIFLGYKLAAMLDFRELYRRCDAYVTANTMSVLKTDEFLKCNRTIIKRILQLDFLTCSEIVVLNACLNWVKHQCHKDDLSIEDIQMHLADSFYDIRFGSMSLEEFIGVYENSAGTFTEDEHDDIVNMIKSPDYVSVKFNNSRRMNYTYFLPSILEENEDESIDEKAFLGRIDPSSTFMVTKQ